MYKLIVLLSLFVMSVSSSYALNIQWSGYGSIVGGLTLENDETITSDWYDLGQYKNDFTMEAESVIALQARSELTDSVSATMQLVAKGADDWDPDIDWFYLTYEANDQLSLAAGRRSIPMYYFSEYIEVGYAYPWIRPPSNLYWWQITQFNSLQASYSFFSGGMDHQITAFYGNERYDGNPLMTYYVQQGFFVSDSRATVNEHWTHITGFNWSMIGDWFDLRFVYFSHDLERSFNLTDGTKTANPIVKQKFIGLGGTVTWENFTLLFDYNYVKRDNANEDLWPSYLVSLVYQWGDFAPYIVYSKADQERSRDPARVLPSDGGLDDYEEHNLLGIGFRYDFALNMAFKLQYDVFEDEGFVPAGWDFHGDASLITLGVDFVF